MSAVLSNHVTSVLCKNRGCLDYKQLQAAVGQHFTVADEVFLKVLGDSSKFAIVQGKEKHIPVCSLSADTIILAKTSLRVCQNHGNSCDDCDKLHLCRYFVCGNCRYRNNCKNSHELNSAHNRAILLREGLQDMVEAELFWLLLQNDSYLLPDICAHYNKGNGEHGSCKFKSSCISLHVCQHFLQGDCKFGLSCKRAHQFDLSAVKVLNGRGLSQDKMSTLHKTYRNRFEICSHNEKLEASPVRLKTSLEPPAVQNRSKQRSTNSISEADSNEICLFYIRRNCSFKEKCTYVHFHLPYKWQVLGSDGKTWEDLSNVEDVEKAYCNPENNTCKRPVLVNFLNMTSGSAPVRRLSTASSVSKPPHFILTTEWLWYYKGDKGKWTEYVDQADGMTTTISSQNLESFYLDNTSDVSFGMGNQQYRVYFKEMYQQNIKYKTKREVRRRPRFLSAQAVEKKLSQGTDTSSSTSLSVLKHLDQGALLDFEYKLVRLPDYSTQYRLVENLFKRTMPSCTIHNIQEIQNPSLWKVFQWQKERMEKKNDGRPVDERLLFHGTEPSLKEAICEHNFDWRICGVHGTAYGKGSYFARDAAYSHKYSKSRDCTRIMFVVLVLVGQFTKGRSSYVIPPPRGTSGAVYDSCVDSEANPSIFVIFEKHQIYPQFIIEYS